MAYVQIVKDDAIICGKKISDNIIPKYGDIYEVEDYLYTYFFEKTKQSLDDKFDVKADRYATLKIKDNSYMFITIDDIIFISKSEVRKLKLNQLKNGLC
jgi:hypothetical protein